MFLVSEGGIVDAIPLDVSQLQPDRSVIVLDEEHLRVWLWHGKKRALVPRRMAMRQAESLKGHGYQAGNAIIGRGIQEIVEIDDRKVGAVPEDTKNSKELIELLSRKFKHIGDNVYIQGGDFSTEGVKPKMASPKVETSATPMSSAPISSSNPSVATSSSSTQAVKLEPTPVQSKPHLSSPKVETAVSLKPIPAEAQKNAPAAVAPTQHAPVKDIKTVNCVKEGCMIIAVNEVFKDLWLSKKPDGSIAVEQMDGKICSFRVDNGELHLLPGSFEGISPENKSKIEAKFKELCSIL